MLTHLEQLMREATAVADAVRQQRLRQGMEPQAGRELRTLEEQLARTWSAIREARSEHGIGAHERQTRPKWD